MLWIIVAGYLAIGLYVGFALREKRPREVGLAPEQDNAALTRRCVLCHAPLSRPDVTTEDIVFAIERRIDLDAQAVAGFVLAPAAEELAHMELH